MRGSHVRSVEVEVRNPSGIHARPAAIFVKGAAAYASKITIENLTSARPPFDAKSMLGLLQTAAKQGHRVRITATGNDEERAVDGLRELIESGLGESVGA